ncbi:MAG: hypothetical protein DCC68_06955 [Planctomycetota bacterium]|nr:MAG: hypothetical protein DCC68_06955 [Planctomycetota bacterium]
MGRRSFVRLPFSPRDRKPRGRRRLGIEALEARQLLCAEHLLAAGLLATADELAATSIAIPPEGLPPVELGPEPIRVGGAAAAPPPTAANGLPLLESRPGAPVALYLDFDGFSGNGYGGQQTHAPYSIDGDSTTYNAQEQTNIIEGWRRISAHFAPFDVNVTTIVPTIPKTWTVITPSFGGPGYSWGQFNGFAPSSFNPQGDLLSRTTGILHEIGHDFGLAHQSEYDLLGNKTKEYRNGYDSLHGPIMGVDYDGSVPKWYIGHPANSPSALQDDVAIIAAKIRPLQGAGGDGFRADDHGNAIGTATVLASEGGVQQSPGIIERLTDRDVFAFTSAGGAVSIDATRDSISGVDMKLEVYAANGTLLAASDTTPNNQFLTLALDAGTYYAAVSSHGDYSDIGPYNLTVQSLPANWQHQDVGNVGQAGYVRYDAATETFAVGGSGTRIGETSDSFHFAYQQLTGDGEIVARVTAIENTNNSAKAGVMIRQSLANNSPHAYMLAATASGSWLRSRTTTGGSSSDSPRADEPFAPIWVRLVRSGDTLTGYTSANGVDWTLEGSTTIGGLPAQVFIGLATTATNNSVVNDSTYTNVTVTGNVGTPPEVVNALPAPTGLAVTATTRNSIALGWDAVDGATGYTIERSADGTQYSQVGTTSAATTTFNNTGLTSFQRYFYRVRASDASGVSVASNFTSGVTRPGAVTSFSVTSWNETQLILNWRDTSGETGYRIERSTDGTNFSTVATVGINVPSYTDGGLTPGANYTYRVVTLDAQGDATTSGTSSSSTRLPAPNVSFSEVAADHITLGWADLNGETEYVVERSTNGTDYAAVATLPAGTTTYRDESVAPLGEYHYRMAARNGSIPGIESDVLFAGTPGGTLPAPWISQDVGNVPGTGAAGFDGETFTLISAGTDLSGTTDSLHFVRQPLVGDGTILARLASLEETSVDAEIGLMVRETLNNNSKSFAVVAAPGEEAHLRYRTSTGGSSTSPGAGPIGPQWLKLTRSGNTFTGYTSADGKTWTQLGSAVTISMSETVHVGLASTSANSEALNLATFDNVWVGLDMPLARPDAVALDEDTTYVGAGGGVLTNDLNFAAGSTAELADGPLSGDLTLTTTGSLIYTPDDDYFGADSLTYRVISPAVAIVPLSARWKYLDNGSNQGTAWQATAFDDGGWASGPAELGYGDGGEATVVAGGPNNSRFATTYFRKTIVLPEGVSASDLAMRLQRDDAAAIYLNGVEVYRDANLPADAEFDDYATSSIPNSEESTLVSIPLPGHALASGANTIAVEVHQGAANSSDVSFSLELTGRYRSAPATVTFDVRPVADLPVAVADDYEAAGGSLDIASPGVLGNDTDADGDSLVALLKSPTTNGALVFNADGSFSYAPNAGFSGEDSFAYAVTDGTPLALVPAQSDWKYLDTGVDPGAVWRELGFDDAAWASGPGQLGYGDDDEATMVNCGPTAPDCNANNFATTYFRRKFTVEDPALVDSLVVDLVRDDAAAVFLNGVQIFRDADLPAAAGHGTYATGTSDENEASSFAVAASLLAAGENILAVEVHQASATSSDVSFDLGLRGRVLSAAATVTITVPSTATPGDFNADDRVDVADLDLLLAAIQNGSVDPLYDVTGDAQVTLADLDYVVANLVETSAGVGTRYGDIDLDGDIDRRDAALLSLQFGRSGPATWGGGDWNASGATDLADLAVLQANLVPPAPPSPQAASAEAIVVKTVRSGAGVRSDVSRTAATLVRAARRTPAGNDTPLRAVRRAREIIASQTLDLLATDAATEHLQRAARYS